MFWRQSKKSKEWRYRIDFEYFERNRFRISFHWCFTIGLLITIQHNNIDLSLAWFSPISSRVCRICQPSWAMPHFKRMQKQTFSSFILLQFSWISWNKFNFKSSDFIEPNFYFYLWDCKKSKFKPLIFCFLKILCLSVLSNQQGNYTIYNFL